MFRRGFRCTNVSPVLPTSEFRKGYTGPRRIKEHVDLCFNTVKSGNQRSSPSQQACSLRYDQVHTRSYYLVRKLGHLFKF